MADISKAGLKKEIAAILKDADLTTTSAKKVREELEDKLDCDLTSRKKEIDDLVMQCLKEKKKDDTKGSKKNGKKDSDEEEEDEEEEEGGGGGGGGGDEEDEEEEDAEEDASEEDEKPKRAAKKPAPKRKKGSSDESEDEDDKDSDDEYSPAKKAKGKAKGKGKGRKKKKGSDSDSDEDWAKNKKGKKAGGGGKRGGGGYTKVCTLTPELAAVVGQDTMARHEVVKKVWSIIKEKNLYDPKNKQFAICNDELLKVFGVKRFRTFGMMKYLKDHFVD